MELAWEEPALARFLRRLASFSRLIAFDKRGTGLSDRVADDQVPTLEDAAEREREYEHVEREWGQLMDLAHYVPSKIGDDR